MIEENVCPSTIFFDSDQLPDRSQVGGKAMSLIQLTRSGLPVPAGFVLPVSFFQPWLDEVQLSPEWEAVLQSPPELWKQRTVEVKSVVAGMALDTERRILLSESLMRLMEHTGPHLFAVRSSSPDEDLEEYSFAGGYVTLLGIKPEKIEEAIRLSFVSCLDERVLAYKREHGLDIAIPRIAVVVQRQLASEKAGVAFSINPLNNDYDEAVINANFGLGETVVSGQVSPDSYLINKVNRAIIERKAGIKTTSIWLNNDGGTYEKPSSEKDQLCLSDDNILSLTEMLVTIENLYQKPMDIEWAIVQNQLYLLQARPITAYFPIPDALRTKPGERRNLYLDLALTKWGMQNLMSVLGLDFLEQVSAGMLRDSMGNVPPETYHALRITTDGRTYVHLSNTIKLQGKKKWVDAIRTQDVLVADTINNLDMQSYLPARLPPELRGVVWKAIGANLGRGWLVLRAMRDPHSFERRLLTQNQNLVKDLYQIVNSKEQVSFMTFAASLIKRLMEYMSFYMPALYASVIAFNQMKSILKDQPPDVQAQINYLERGLSHNVTVEMGLSMYQLAQFPEIRESISYADFRKCQQDGQQSQEFTSTWDKFIHDFGFRGPMEMDSAVARFADQPAHLFNLLKDMSKHQDEQNNSQAVYERAIRERINAYRNIVAAIKQKNRRKASQFMRAYETYSTLGGFRESGKYFFVLMTNAFRKRVLSVGEKMVEGGRLEQPEQIFGLSIQELDQAIADPSFELRSLIAKNNHYWNRYRHIREFPAVFDSRGRVLRAPRKPAQEGEVLGEPISAGTVTGRVKILHQSDEKPLLPGEILITRATDPGWTPLFINAGGIILEVGGLLQHGALVAREYGKPCVAGIENATEVFKEGQLVELNGSTGIVRILNEPRLS